MLSNPKNESTFLMQALNQAMLGVWHIQVRENQLFINDSLARIIGYQTDEIRSGPNENWVKIGPGTEHPFLNELTEQLTKTSNAQSFSYDCSIKHKSGYLIDVQINGRITQYDQSGEPTQITGTLFNISNLTASKQSLEYRYKIEKLVSGISSDFAEMKFDLLDNTINRTLEKIGVFCRIDRSYLFLLHRNKQMVDNTHEWCATGITNEKNNLQNLPCSILPWWMKQLEAQKHIYIYDVAEMPKEAAIEQQMLEMQHIKSLLVVPIHYNTQLFGFMGFDSVTAYKHWHQSDIELLETVGNNIANALNAKHNHELLVLEKERAEESDRLKSAFMATMNHELRTPLHHILGFSDLLRGGKNSTEKIEFYASRIYDSGKNLLQIIEDVLNLTIANHNQIKARQEQIEGINLYLQHKSIMNELLVATNREKEIKLKFSASTTFMHTTFLTDKNKINQILINLFKNALKFTKKGSIEYHATIRDKKLFLTVKDHGVGIPEMQKRTIFDFFRQGDDSMTRRFHGIGIGLTIAKKIVNILNGDILVESIPGKGSTFTIVVPVEMPEPENKSIGTNLIFPLPDFSKHRLLIVDEDANGTFLMKNLLKGTNANIFSTRNQTGALSYMTDHCLPDIILVDIKASSEESINLVRAMKTRCTHCPVIGITAYSLLSVKEKALNAGCVDVISKPVEMQLLFESIKKALVGKKK